MPFIRALISALTFFGGHLLNRRLDRVVQIFGLLALVAVASYLLLPQLLFRLGRSPAAYEWALLAPRLLVCAVALVSALVTWFDARQAPPAPLSLTSRLAGIGATVFGFALAGLVLLTFLPERTRLVPTPSGGSTTSTITRNFYASAHLGGHAADAQPPEPPSGKHPMRGRIVLDGHGVAEASVQLVLNEAFETEPLATDDEGYFETALPAGPWRINRVSVVGWDDAPSQRDLLLFSDLDPRKEDDVYSRYDHEARGLALQLPSGPPTETPTFYLRDAIQVQWPQRTELFTMPADAALPDASIAESSVRWTAAPRAVEYEVQIQSLTRKQNSMSYGTILRRRLPATTLALASLPQRTTPTPTPQEYRVEIFAFDASNRLVTATSDRTGQLVFQIAGTTQLAEERPHMTRARSASGEYFKNMERLSLVASLLDYKQLEAAKDILAEVTQDAPPGRKAGLEGAIAALEGRCAEAIALFDRADAEGGAGCAPPKYRQLCESR